MTAIANNNIVCRGDLNGSTRGFHGGSVFVDPSSQDERYKMVYLGLFTTMSGRRSRRSIRARRTRWRGDRTSGDSAACLAYSARCHPTGCIGSRCPNPLMIQHADTQNTCYYDVDRKIVRRLHARVAGERACRRATRRQLRHPGSAWAAGRSAAP